ncbi:Hypothetical protein R9X50_00353700 [Acrodontium crateriforme]|uniref:Phytanoyl-CoA dioxygenase n=1 Tax=Acrodontium crateriforme TaxID=150365 RepID=A0AAQ3M988_9PEZI|nr:Hypothetical protein R9X50_00353700 [Acrodontium crateriforme]
MARLNPEQLRASLAKDGFVRIPAAIPADRLEKFREAATEATRLARAGQWPYIRTVGKQFPPWNVEDRDKGVWGVQHLMHPDMPAHLRKTFAESYFDDEVVQCVRDLLQAPEDTLVMELYNMLVRPEYDYALRWHRDDIPPTVSPEEELERLQHPMKHAQWNLSLWNDSSLIVVPGSHKRARTEEERAADPFAAHLPNMLIVEMQPGDIVFYNNNILHRGVYDHTAERMTLHGTIGLTGKDDARARNILQHGIGSWASKSTFAGLGMDPHLEARAEAMQKRLIAMGSGENVGFSQDD